MPPKRRRLSKNPQTEDEGRPEEENSATIKPQPHEDFWFEDGSIVLATDVHLYRVHKGMLSRFSKVLNDLFELPTGDADADNSEGVPIVRMVGDSDEGVLILLRALYGMSLRDTLGELTLMEIASLLSISSKYDFQDIRAIVKQYLESLFPDTLKKYKDSKIHKREYPSDHLFELIALARRCEVPMILPTLYYLCARLPMEKLVVHLDNLPKDVSKALLLGRTWMSENPAFYLIGHSLQYRKVGGEHSAICKSSRCLEEFRSHLSNFPGGRSGFVSIFDIPDRGVLDGVDMKHSKICEDCADTYVKSVGTSKQRAWNVLSSKFMGKMWNELNGK
ncbi:hypothetical protein SCHPADRAFT_862430 [Schizopora paradoxa]|uniref:BTB domain-containing protein n=1 Tax=Schizopora paradoxa TaxID=27342 RepID=A0A0H2R0Y4_9AGAM|nr:hypothetical protein SCHPADRAFT_862430 [Schizopora paradoxa]